MVATLIVSLITCIVLIVSILAFPKIKMFNKEINTYWIVCLIGAIFILLFKGVSVNESMLGLFENSSINPIKILILFFSMTFLSIFLDEVGFFKFIASILTNRCKTNQTSLFFSLYALVSILTIFTSNDIVILTFTPFICYFTKNTKINPIPYLVAEFTAANTWSMMLIIGNPTNIYLATSANINFIEYFKVMFLPTLSAGLTQLLLMYLIFRNELKQPMQIEESHIKVKSKLDLGFSLGHLLICIVFLVISSYLNISMWIICILCATSLFISIATSHVIRHKSFESLKRTFLRLPYDLIPFILSMFIIVLALQKQGITDYIYSFLGNNNIILKYGFSSFAMSNLINNIPMSVLFSKVINFTDPLSLNQAIYSTIIGSNIGAFLTPIGALAGIMFTDLVRRQEVTYSFLSFIKYGLIISIPTLLVALLLLFITL